MRKLMKHIIFLLTLISLQDCKGQNDKKIKELNKFYSLYFSAMENVDNTSENDLDLIKRKYMTSQLYEKLKKINMDYDPVINAQDVDSNWQKSIDINHVKDDLFKMCIKNSYDKSLNCTYLKVEENFKIYDIQVNDIASILNYINEDETYIEAQNNIINKDSVNAKIISGNYQYGKCSESKPSYYFIDDEGQFNFYTPKNKWVSISTTSKKNGNIYGIQYNFLTGVSGENKDLDWNNFSMKDEIAEIKVIDNNHLEFKWLGFYNLKKKQKDFLENPFNKDKNPIVLERCNK
ncbi:hypothetical protein [Chryseobacterium sp. G0201]|uniref:hypothetical protein n=1 Tax=Chryseobacterium sp. G0201 TaxID=2487065 RepID=UPI000F4EF359|nr:hypothetical protein [Chryseobacterium sp. G0201]